MSNLNQVILNLKRANSPFLKFAKKVIRKLFAPTLPPFPRFLKSPLRIVYELHFLVVTLARSVVTICYSNPLFQSRCATFGKRVSVTGLPYVDGHVEIHVGDDVTFGGNVNILSGRIFDHPQLIMKDRSGVGWNTTLTVNKEIILEEDVIVSYDCRISDTDGHCREADLRAQGVSPDPKDIRPVRICRNAWIGNGTHIMKGVVIGEGAIIGANSVVISNIPAYALALGNPAEVLMHNVGLPSTMRRTKRPAAPAQTKS